MQLLQSVGIHYRYLTFASGWNTAEPHPGRPDVALNLNPHYMTLQNVKVPSKFGVSGGRVGSTGRYSVLQRTAQKLGDDGGRRLGCPTLTAGLRMVLRKNAGRGQDGVGDKDGKTRSCYTLIRLDAVENIFDFTHALRRNFSAVSTHSNEDA